MYQFPAGFNTLRTCRARSRGRQCQPLCAHQPYGFSPLAGLGMAPRDWERAGLPSSAPIVPFCQQWSKRPHNITLNIWFWGITTTAWAAHLEPTREPPGKHQTPPKLKPLWAGPPGQPQIHPLTWLPRAVEVPQGEMGPAGSVMGQGQGRGKQRQGTVKRDTN